MKKKNKGRGKQTRGRKPSEPMIEFSSIAIQGPRDKKSMATFLKEAEQKVAGFSQTFELVRDQFRQTDPLVIMAIFAHSLLRDVDRKGVPRIPAVNDLQQFHGELLQAVLLTVPPEEWGAKPLEIESDVMHRVSDAVPELFNSFFHERLIAAQKIEDERKRAVMSLQCSIQFHTQAVRNWGYFGHVIEISTNLYRPLDGAFYEHYGFSISDLIKVMKIIGAEYERRLNDNSVIAQLDSPASLTEYLNQEFSKRAVFKIEEVAALTGYAPQLAGSVLREVSLLPGALVNAKAEHLILGNPVWSSPSIDLGQGYFIPMPQVTFSHIHSLIARLGLAAGLKPALEKARSRYLESELGEALKTALPSASIDANVKWRPAGKGHDFFETDYLVKMDRLVLIAEAKSHRLTPEGLRGAPDRIKRHVDDLVLEPSMQSVGLENLILAAKLGDDSAKAEAQRIGIDPTKIDRVIRLSVTLDDFSVLCSQENQFKQVGWVPVDHDLAPAVSIADFRCIVDILDNPIVLLHYLSERALLQKSFELYGDEMDFLGLYLETGFNLSALEEQHETLSATGLSGRIDRYYDALNAGVKFSKPTPKLRPLFRDSIERLCHRRPEGWVMVGMHLLNSADYAEQQRLEKDLTKLKRMVRRNYRNPTHVCSVQIQPSSSRKARLIFHVYPEVLRNRHKYVMERLALEALGRSTSDVCCVFGRCIDEWDTPYESLCLVRNGTPG